WVICKSRAYQHSLTTNRWNQDDDVNYSHAYARRLQAEVLYDAIHRVTGSVAGLPGLLAVARPAPLLDSIVEFRCGFLELFAKRKVDLATYESRLPAKQAEWEKNLQSQPAWTTLEVVEAKATGGAVLNKQSDGSLLATGPNPTPSVYTVTATSKLKGITALRLEVLPDPTLSAMGPGRAGNGNFVLNELTVTASPEDNP